jgi:predicted DsbA family dithiol-disulfide isomerase
VLATPAGIPLPAVGVAGFLAIGVTALLPTSRARRVEFLLSGLAGFVGLILLGAQIHIGHFCPYCSVADASGLLCAVVSGGRLRWAADAPVPLAASSGGAAALIAAAVGPLVAGFYASGVPVHIPEVIRDQIARTPRGLVTIVDFVDFECPFCRMTHAELAPMVEAHKERIRLVRVQVPLRSHSHALDAAHAACCSERLGKGDAMANALFTAPVDELTPEGCERIAASLGLPMDQYRACVADPTVAARIEQDRAEFKAASGYALPTIWIGERQFVGAQPAEVLAAALHDALARAGS